MKDYRVMEALFKMGLHTEGLGPIQEWSPVPATMHQRRHDTFWRAVVDILPDDDEDDEDWMTEEAASDLEANN